MDIEQIKQTLFYQDSPIQVNTDALVELISGAYDGCDTSEESSFVDSRINDYRRNPIVSKWYGTYAEFVFLDWLKELSTSCKVALGRNKAGSDIKIAYMSKELNVEVKSIQDTDYSKLKRVFTYKLRNIPTGKFLNITYRGNLIDEETSPKPTESEFEELLEAVSLNKASKYWEIKYMGRIDDNNKTGYMGFSDAYTVNYEWLNLAVTNRLHRDGQINSQVKNADVVCFYIFDMRIDSEDMIKIIEELPAEFENKIFAYFTSWQGGKPIYYSKKLSRKIDLNEMLTL